MYEDLTDVLVDTEQGVIKWTEHIGMTEEAKLRQKASYIEKGMDVEEAERRVEFEGFESERFEIVHHYVSNQKLWIDEITGELLDPPKLVPAHTFLFLDEGSILHLYIPESSGHAILMRPRGTKEASWVSLRFGKCRKTN